MHRPRFRSHHGIGLALVLALLAPGSGASAPRSGGGARARNVILFVADGAGFNAWLATAMYEGRVGRDVCDGSGWVRLAADTYPLRIGRDPGVSPEFGLAQQPELVYDPVRAWDGTPMEGQSGRFPYCFAGYRWLRRASDSANTATAMSTGHRTYTSAINVGGDGRPLEATLARLARESGRRVGVVTSVPWSHATPAALGGAHAVSRDAYESIALEMLTAGDLDVIAGCGHPDFDNNGRRIADPATRMYRYVGGERVWASLTGARAVAVGDTVLQGTDEAARVLSAEDVAALQGWRLAESRSDIEALSEGPTPPRLLLVPRVGEVELSSGAKPGGHDVGLGATLQQARGTASDARYTAPGEDPLLDTVPSLADLTRAALNALDDEPAGFYLHVEGGAVDWAMHDNQMGRMVEEMMDFKQALEAVVAWVETHGGWNETLVLVTADHDHLLWGPRSHVVPFDPLRDGGAGQLPAYRWLHDGHSSALVPLMARGPGADRLVTRAAGEDPFRGPYLAQTEIFEILRAAMGE